MNNSAFEQNCLDTVQTLLKAYLQNDEEQLQNITPLLAKNFVFIDECNIHLLLGQSVLATGTDIYSLKDETDALCYDVQRLNTYSCIVYGFSAKLRCSCICSLNPYNQPCIDSLHLSLPFDPFSESERTQDSLTGLLNRMYTEKQILHQLRENTCSHLLFMIDLDNFKCLNDFLGHQTGDNILINVSQILRNKFGKDAVIGRVGGDEFLILVPSEHLSHSPEATAQAVIDSITTLLKQYELSQSCSVGILSVPPDYLSFHSLYQAVDKAMYAAKAAGKASYKFGTLE